MEDNKRMKIPKYIKYDDDSGVVYAKVLEYVDAITPYLKVQSHRKISVSSVLGSSEISDKWNINWPSRNAEEATEDEYLASSVINA